MVEKQPAGTHDEQTGTGHLCRTGKQQDLLNSCAATALALAKTQENSFLARSLASCGMVSPRFVGWKSLPVGTLPPTLGPLTFHFCSALPQVMPLTPDPLLTSLSLLLACLCCSVFFLPLRALLTSCRFLPLRALLILAMLAQLRDLLLATDRDRKSLAQSNNG